VGVAVMAADAFELLDEDARADSAPVALDVAYQARRKWKPGNYAGFIINTIIPVARLAWPKQREGKEFLARIETAFENPPDIPAKPAGKPRQQRAKR
jgi:hypothetical protein